MSGLARPSPLTCTQPYRTLQQEAELINGRLAMLGIISVTMASVLTGTPIVDVVNLGLGKILY